MIQDPISLNQLPVKRISYIRMCLGSIETFVFRTFEQVIAKIYEYQERDAFFGWMMCMT